MNNSIVLVFIFALITMPSFASSPTKFERTLASYTKCLEKVSDRAREKNRGRKDIARDVAKCDQKKEKFINSHEPEMREAIRSRIEILEENALSIDETNRGNS